MAPHDMAQLLPSNRRRPRRSVLAPVLGGITTLLTVLTLCVFASHLPALQRATVGGGSTAGRPRVVMPRNAAPDPAPPPQPHHGSPPITPPTPPPTAHHGPSELEVVLSIIEEQIKQDNDWPDHMEYGANKHPPFKDDPPMLVADLPRKYVPSYSPPPAATQGERGDPVEDASKISARRLVIVGDVHGHLVSLKALLKKVGFNNKHGDHLILAGDIVTKGPDSKGVVKLAMELGASAVRGNQDDRVLAAAGELRRLSADDESRLGQELADAEDGAFVDTAEDDGGKVDAETRRRDHARKVARSLSRAQLAWLKSHPIILRVSHLQEGGTAPWDASTLVVVHGGLVPGVRLEKQDAWAVMNMRSLVYPGKGKRKGKGKGKKHHAQSETTAQHDAAGGAAHTTPGADDDATLAPESVAVPVDGRKGEPWSHAWNRHQNNLPPSAPRTVAVYGHDARAGLQVDAEADIAPYGTDTESDTDSDTTTTKPKKTKRRKSKLYREDASTAVVKPPTGPRYAFGLDSGCGHGRQLTALIVEAGPGGITHRVEQVDCAASVREDEAERAQQQQQVLVG